MKIIGLPKETPSLIEASRLCSSTVFSSIGTLNRLHKFLKWVQPRESQRLNQRQNGSAASTPGLAGKSSRKSRMS